jgi:serine protease inhibitor
MRKALRFELPQAKLHPLFNKLDLELQSRGKRAKGSDGAAFELFVANSLWGRPGGTYLPSFLDLMALIYGAGIRLVDFAGDTEGARQEINAWVAQKTRERIKGLLKKGDIDGDTALVLVNGDWYERERSGQRTPQAVPSSLKARAAGSRLRTWATPPRRRQPPGRPGRICLTSKGSTGQDEDGFIWYTGRG